jgi:hypothetical protein
MMMPLWRSRNLNELPNKEVGALLDSYPLEITDVTSELYGLGQLLLAEGSQRAGELDKRASVVVGFAGVILGFIMNQIPKWVPIMSHWEIRWPCVVSATAALGATVSGALVMFGSAEWIWFSEADWFRKEVLVNSERLRRYYVRTMHGVNQHNGHINDRKGRQLLFSQRCLAIAVAALAVMLILHLLVGKRYDGDTSKTVAGVTGSLSMDDSAALECSLVGPAVQPAPSVQSRAKWLEPARARQRAAQAQSASCHHRASTVL